MSGEPLRIAHVKFLRHQLPEIKKYLFSRGKTPDLPLKLTPLLSEFMWGITRKALTVIGARTSEGKSTLAMQIAYDLAIQGKTVLLLSLETTVEKMGARLFCLHNKFNNTKAFRGGLQDDPQAWDKFEREIAGIPLVINDMLGKTWEDIEQVLKDTKLGPDAVIVDYIQTIATQDGKNKLDTMNEYIRQFREMAIRNDFAGVVCSQINRTMADEKTKEPQLHQLKGSGFLEEHADVVILLSWPYKYLKHSEGKVYTQEQFHRFYAYVAKNKDGQTGYQKLKFTPDYYLFEDWIEQPKEVRSVKEQDLNWQD